MADVREYGFELGDHHHILLIWHHLFSVPQHEKITVLMNFSEDLVL